MTLQQPGSMKVWKSPVLYFGVLLAVAVVALLLAPFIVNWNGYRADLEAYGRTLTGREVTIEGPISARLFPWPRLTADAVSIANVPGAAEEKFASAERITIRMTLAGLLQGGLDVESIDVEAPVLNLERLEQGGGNWVFAPSEDLIRSDILSRVRLDQIRLVGGTAHYRDWRRSETLTLDDLNATISSPGVAGPWRMRSQAIYEDRGVDIAINTGNYVEGQPFRFGLSLAAADGSGYVFGFDGAAKDGTAEGQIRIAPATADSGKGDAEGRIRPLAFTAQVKGGFDRLAFEKIEVTRLDPGQNGALVTGAGALQLGRDIEARLDLKAAMLDIDALAGARSLTTLREAGMLAVTDSLLKLLPSGMTLAGSLDVTALKAGGHSLDNVRLALAASPESLRIERLSAGLPGRSEMLFKGGYRPAGGDSEVTGDLALETSDLRELVLWLWPAGRKGLGELWSGDRGRLKMQTGIGITASRLKLTGTDFELDGERGKGALAVTTAGRGAIDLTLESGRFNLDSYAPQGIPAFSAAVREGVTGIVSLAMPRADAPDLKLSFKAGEVLLNAVTARGVTVDLQSGANGLDLRALDISSVGGARVVATGLVLDTGKGADGTIGLEVEAGDPSGLIRMLGLAGSDGLPLWAQGLGPTAVRASLAVKPEEQGSELHFRASGSAGDLNIAGQGTAAPGMELSGNFAVTSPDSGRILALFGVPALLPDSEPGALRLEMAGTPAEGFMTTAALQAHGTRLDYRGSFNPWAEGYGLDGQLSLKAGEAAALAAVAGLPAAVPAGGGMSAEARLAWGDDGRWSLSGLSGRFADEPFSGTASLTPARVAEARIETGPLRLKDVMAAAFLDWAGPAADLETGFAAGLPFGLTGELWITPRSLAVHPHFEVSGAEIAVAGKPDALNLTMFAKDRDGRGAQIEMTSARTDAGRKITGFLSLPLDLGRQLALAGGQPVAEGQGKLELRFASEGRSPAGALAAVEGEGRYDFENLRLLRLTPQAFATALGDAKDATGITRAFDALRGGAGLDFGPVAGTIGMKEGQVSFAPFSLTSAAADVEVKTLAELALAQIDADVTLRLKAREGLPPMSVSYAGPPQALARVEDNSELATALGVTIMQQGIDELERLQQEQQRLAKLEEQQRIEDEARLQAYYAQRDELLLRRREVKVHTEMQVMEADRLRRQIEQERAANAEINRLETRQRQRELRVWRRLARLSEAPATTPAQAAAQAPAEKPADEAPAVKPAVQAQPKPKQLRKPQTPQVKPVILAKPPGAPVIISPEPGLPPSQ